MSAINQVLASFGVPSTDGLDIYSTGLKAVRCLKRKYTGYSGGCIRIRRSSDNTEQDIGFVSSSIDAAVDSSAAVAFAGAGSAFVTTIYDQSGSGDHWVQATSGKQPRVVNSGVWDGFVRFDGTDDSMESTNNSGAVARYHVAMIVALRTTGAASGDKAFFERGVNLGGNSNNENSVFHNAVAGSELRIYRSNGTTSFDHNRYNIATSGVLPSISSAHWAEFAFDVAGVNGMKWFAGSTLKTADSYNGTLSTPLTGTAIKWYLAARNNTTFFADLNWAGDAIYEGAVSDVDKAAIQAILVR